MNKYAHGAVFYYLRPLCHVVCSVCVKHLTDHKLSYKANSDRPALHAGGVEKSGFGQFEPYI